MKEALSYCILVSFQHIGDYNQALDVQSSYQSSSNNSFVFTLVNAEDENFLQHFQTPPQFVHSFGEKGLMKLGWLVSNNHLKVQTVTIVQIHQHFDELLQIKPAFLIIPETNYKSYSEFDQTHKVLLKGTPFEKVSPQKLKSYYEESVISKEIDLTKNYLLIMLSGDAPDGKTMKFFTKESADELVYKIVFLLGKYSSKQFELIIQNGPRTGKHSPETSKQVCLHTFKNGQDQSIAIDEISKYFVQKIKNLKLKHSFFNFAFEITAENKRLVHSYYKPLLYVAQQQDNIFMFPMESVSMCSQLPYYIRPNHLFAYNTSSTNESHLKFVENGFQRGLYQKFAYHHLLIEEPLKYQSSNYSETKQITDQIIDFASKHSKDKMENSSEKVEL